MSQTRNYWSDRLGKCTLIWMKASKVFDKACLVVKQAVHDTGRELRAIHEAVDQQLPARPDGREHFCCRLTGNAVQGRCCTL